MCADLWCPEDPVGPVGAHLSSGGVLVVPTESSYALAADPRSERGVEAIFSMKGRASGEPLPLVVADERQARELGIATDDRLFRAALRLWPAALSVVVAARSQLPASAGLATVAVRVPAHSGLRELLARLGHGLTATSANRSGQPPIVDPGALEALVDSDTIVYADGVLAGGLPSTVVTSGASGVRILRAGRFPADELARLKPG